MVNDAVRKVRRHREKRKLLNSKATFLALFLCFVNSQNYSIFECSIRSENWRSMSKDPQGQKRPADVVGCAVAVARIATGEAKETLGKVRKSGNAESQRREP